MQIQAYRQMRLLALTNLSMRKTDAGTDTVMNLCLGGGRGGEGGERGGGGGAGKGGKGGKGGKFGSGKTSKKAPQSRSARAGLQVRFI